MTEFLTWLSHHLSSSCPSPLQRRPRRRGKSARSTWAVTRSGGSSDRSRTVATSRRASSERALGVGDDVARHGRISDAKLAEIEETLIAFARSCQNEGVTRVVAIGTAAFREAPNGATVIALAAKHRISMEIATERRESELAYLVGSLGREGYAVIDNGSRSIELVSQRGTREALRRSSTWAIGSRTRRSSQRLRIRTLLCRRFATA